MFDVPSGSVDFTSKVPRIYTKAAYSADGKWLAAFSGAVRVTFWETDRQMATSELSPPDPEADEQWNALAFDPSGQRLAIAGMDTDKHGLVPHVGSWRCGDGQWRGDTQERGVICGWPAA